jgi:hypothetical protein
MVDGSHAAFWQREVEYYEALGRFMARYAALEGMLPRLLAEFVTPEDASAEEVARIQVLAGDAKPERALQLMARLVWSDSEKSSRVQEFIPRVRDLTTYRNKMAHTTVAFRHDGDTGSTKADLVYSTRKGRIEFHMEPHDVEELRRRERDATECLIACFGFMKGGFVTLPAPGLDV